MSGARVAPAATAMPSAPVDPLVLGATPRRVLWVLLVVFQLFNGALLACFALLYATRNTRGSLMWTAALYFLFAEAYAFIDAFYLVIAVTYAVLSTAFALSGLRLVWLSLRGRRLKFGGSERTQRPTFARSKSQLLSAVLAPFEYTGWANNSLWRRFTEWVRVLSFAVGVRGPFFDLRILADRIVGVTTQTVAAYSSSISISNVYLNQAYGLVLFLSCISTPVFHRVFRTDLIKQRLAHLFSDLVLDFVWGSIIPIWMHIPIVKMYYTALTEAITDSETSAREIRRVLVLSWMSLVLSLIPFITSLVSSLEIQAVLIESSKQALRKTSLSTCPAIQDAKPKHSVHVDSMIAVSRKPVWTRLFRLAHGAIVLYACVVLVISLAASDMLGLVTKQPQFACVYRLHPWFSTKEACVKRYVNCSAVGIDGNRTEMEVALNLFDSSSLSDLHFQSCAALNIPDTIHRFSGLNTIMVQDSWIDEWPMSAAVTSEYFTDLKAIKLLSVDTNATLHGLVSAPIAETVEYIRFYDVPNADTILRPIGSNWQHIRYFDCDACGLSDVPNAVDAMYQLLTLSLAESHVVVLRDDWITRWELKLIGLWMDDNEDLTELSDTVWRQAATSSMFSMQFSNLSIIPEWVPTIMRSDFVVYGYGTPLCDTNANILGSSSSKVRGLVSCEYVEQ